MNAMSLEQVVNHFAKLKGIPPHEVEQIIPLENGDYAVLCKRERYFIMTMADYSLYITGERP